jgi:hypothetical protein
MKTIIGAVAIAILATGCTPEARQRFAMGMANYQAQATPYAMPVVRRPTQCREYCYTSGPNRYCNSQCD